MGHFGLVSDFVYQSQGVHRVYRKILEKWGEGIGKLHVSSPNLIYIGVSLQQIFQISRRWDLKSHKPNRNTESLGTDAKKVSHVLPTASLICGHISMA